MSVSGSSFKPKLKPEQIREILAIELPIRYKRSLHFYREIAKRYSCNESLIRNILSDKKSVSGDLYRSIALRKQVTPQKAINIITDMYKDYFNDIPVISAVDRYQCMQIVIKPKMIILQFDEHMLIDINQFVKLATMHMRDAVMNYNKRNEKEQ